MNWIRIATKMKGDPRMGSIAAACKVPIPGAVGLVVCLLTELPDHAKDGVIVEIPDVVLEQWALWTGKSGVFAAAFRAHMCDDGVVRSWEKHNGAALREVDRTRERAKEWRDKQKETEYVRGTNGARNGDRIRTESVDETRRDVTATTTRKADDDVTPSASVAAVFSQIAPCVAPVGHEALRTLLASVKSPESWAGIIRGCAAGLSMPDGQPASAERLATALQDFVAAGHHTDPRTLTKLFRGFVGSAKASAPRVLSRGPTLEEDRAEQLRLLREQNERRRMRHEPPKVEPTWAAQIDAMFPDGRTQPGSVAA